MQKQILVPTDFSETASKALDYATNLAVQEKISITLVHAIFLDARQAANPALAAEVLSEEEANNKLNSTYGDRLKKAGVDFKCISKVGFAADVVIAVARQVNPWMLVMGTHGASGVQEILLGSNAAKVIEKTECPVIAVPDGISYRGIKNITYATDYNSSDLSALKTLIGLATPLKARITILHISDGELSQDAETEMMHKFKAACLEVVSYEHLDFKLVSGTDLEKSLQSYIQAAKPDLLAMSTMKRTMIDKFFGPSVTKKMAFHSTVPLLAFHHKKDSIIFIS